MSEFLTRWGLEIGLLLVALVEALVLVRDSRRAEADRKRHQTEIKDLLDRLMARDFEAYKESNEEKLPGRARSWVRAAMTRQGMLDKIPSLEEEEGQ